MSFEKIFYKGKEVTPDLNAPTETILVAKDAQQADEWRKEFPGIKVYLEQPLDIRKLKI